MATPYGTSGRSSFLRARCTPTTINVSSPPAIDMNKPEIRDAVARATFEHLIGFQLTQEQLRYNATR